MWAASALPARYETIQTPVAAKRSADLNGWNFEVDQDVSEAAERLFKLAGIGTFIWG